jgi:hypothetical protein
VRAPCHAQLALAKFDQDDFNRLRDGGSLNITSFLNILSAPNSRASASMLTSLCVTMPSRVLTVHHSPSQWLSANPDFGKIIFVRLHVRLHKLGRHQPHRMRKVLARAQ